jgi:hypothetical protein
MIYFHSVKWLVLSTVLSQDGIERVSNEARTNRRARRRISEAKFNLEALRTLRKNVLKGTAGKFWFPGLCAFAAISTGSSTLLAQDILTVFLTLSILF